MKLLGRWRLLSGGSSEYGDRRWDVKRIIWSSEDQKRFQGYKFYASSRIIGGRRTFWRIDFWTFESQGAMAVDRAGSPMNSDVERSASGSSSPSFSVVLSNEKKLDYIVWLDKYCREHPGEFASLGGPGMRAPSRGTLQ